MLCKGCVTKEIKHSALWQIYHIKTRRTEFLNIGKIAKDIAIPTCVFVFLKRLGTCFNIMKEYDGKNGGNISK